MRLKLFAVAVAAAMSLSLLGATGAGAATEVGNGCISNRSSSGFLLVSLANAPGNPLPATIPAAGVITRWTFFTGLSVPPEMKLRESLKVFRPAGIPQQLQVVGESSSEVFRSGFQTFPTRIPVKAGDLIGALTSASQSTGATYCETGAPGDRVGLIDGTASQGSTVAVAEEITGLQNPITVSIEPDADNDGFGDETQDGCPQGAAFQGPCPQVVLSVSSQVRKRSATVIVTSSTAAPVSVKGVVKMGKGKKATLNGGAQSVVPGVFGKFNLKFTKGLRAKLRALSPKKSRLLNVTAAGTSLSGTVTTQTLKVKLKGQAKD